MKKRPSLIVFVSALMLLNGGCGGSPSSSPSPSPSVSPSPGTVPTPPVPSSSPQAATPPNPNASPTDLAVLGLIPSTKSNQRRQEILAGRTNPFALIPVQATIRQSVCVAPPPIKPEAVAMAIPSQQRSETASASKTNTPGVKSVKNRGETKTAPSIATAPSVVLPNPSPLFGNVADNSSETNNSGGLFGNLPSSQGASNANAPANVSSPDAPTKTPTVKSKTTSASSQNQSINKSKASAVKASNAEAIAAQLPPFAPKTPIVKTTKIVKVKPINPQLVAANPHLVGKSKSVTVEPKKGSKNSAILAKASLPSAAIPEMIPTQANAVEVSGVMKIGNKPFAIVKAPGEAVSRYVGVGSRLSNGAVRVSAINTSVDNPGITVEQYGISVVREVGQPPEGATPASNDKSTPVVPSINYYRTISPQARSGNGISSFLGMPSQFLAQLPGGDNRDVPTFEAVPKGPTIVALVPPDNSGFGEVRNLSLLALKIQMGGALGSTKSTGIICNTGKTAIQVGDLTLQLEDKTSNTILDSMVINFPKTYSLKYGQKLEFDGSIPDFRGRNLKSLTVKLIDWSNGKP